MLADIAREIELSSPEELALRDTFNFSGASERILKSSLRRYGRALALDPNFSWGYYHRGVVEHLANDFDGALADFGRCSEFPDLHLKDYAAIHTWLVPTEKGESARANLELSTYLSIRTNGMPSDWEVKIARFLLDQISEAEFSASLGVSDAERERSQFWYYAGMKHLLAGDKGKAAEYLRKSRTTETRPYAVEMSTRIKLSMLAQ
jgi:lipoprotein NlpI